MGEFKRTIFFQENKIQGAKFVEFAGYEMPVMYTGIIDQHLAIRKRVGLFDISHMGRFLVRGRDALRFLQHSSTNNVQALDKPEKGAQYTLIPNETGGAVDDAYLYRFVQDEYLLVVNAANRSKDRNHFQASPSNFEEVEFLEVSQDVAMLTFQSSNSRRILNAVLQSGHCLNQCAMLSVSLALTAVRSKSPEPLIPLSHWASNCP